MTPDQAPAPDPTPDAALHAEPEAGPPAAAPGPAGPDRLFPPSVLAAIVAFLAVQAVYWVRVHPPWLTDTLYLFMARSLRAGDLYHAVHFHLQPLYAWFIALLQSFTPSIESAGRLAGLISSALTIVPTVWLCRRLFGRPVALIAAGLLPFMFFRFPLMGEAETMLRLLLFCGLAAGWVAIESRRGRDALLAGAVFGLASLAKIEAQLFFVYWCAVLLGSALRARLPLRRAAGLVGLAWLGYLVVMSPYLGAYTRATGWLSLNPKTAPLLFIYNEPDWNDACYQLRRDADGRFFVLYQRVLAEGDRRPVDLHFGAWLRRNSGQIARNYLDRLAFSLRETLPALLWYLTPRMWVAAGLVILAGFARRRFPRRRLAGLAYLGGAGLLNLLSVPLFSPDLRFYASLHPLLVIFFALGVERLAEIPGFVLRRDEAGRARRKAWAAAVLVALALAPNLHALLTVPRETEFYAKRDDLKMPADWLRQRLRPGERVMSSWTNVPFFHLLGVPPADDLFIPVAPLDEVLAYARQERVTWLVIGNNEYSSRFPLLQPLLDPRFEGPGLERVYSLYTPHGYYFVIYRLLPGPGPLGRPERPLPPAVKP